MKRALPYMLAVGGALVVWLLAYLFFSNYTRVEVTRENLYRNEAARDPFFAAETFLNRMQLPTESRPLLGAMPAPDGLLVLGPGYDGLDPFLAEQLADWVDQGGRVLLMPRPATRDQDVHIFEDALLGELGLEVINHDPQVGFFEQMNEAVAEDAEADSEAQDEGATEASSGEEEFGGSSGGDAFQLPWQDSKERRTRDLRFEERPGLKSYQVKQSTQFQLQDPWAMAENQGDTDFMRLPFGEGEVLAMTELDFLHSRNLGELDHGMFFWDLCEYLGVKSVTFVYLQQSPSIWSELVRKAWMAWVPLLLLLVLWLWSATRRFGPPLPDPPLARRSLLEHIEACAWYLWRGQHQQELVEASRTALYRRMEFRRPGWSKDNKEQLVRRLARISGLDQNTVRQSLEDNPGHQTGAFSEIIKNLETMRRQL